jgi:DNA-directed RNA polymerase specialized sigma24 family protein
VTAARRPAADPTPSSSGPALVAALPIRKRAALTLQVSGHSHREIAARLDMTERTVERQIRRGRAAVRRAHIADAPPIPA